MNNKKMLFRKMLKPMILLNIILIVIAIISVFFAYKEMFTLQDEIVNVKQPSAAGQFYPADKEKLKVQVDAYLEDAQPHMKFGEVRALIVPHAGYIYSGQIAAEGYRQLDREYKKIIIIAVNHNEKAKFSGIAITNATHFKTPLGDVKVSEIEKNLSSNNLFVYDEQAFDSHVIEVHLPFLQEQLGDFEIIPLITSYLSEQQVSSAASELEKYVDDDTLIIISTDLSHYKNYDDAVKIDSSCIDAVKSMDYSEVSRCDACGIFAIKMLEKIAEDKGWRSSLLSYKNSGDVTGDKTGVVGYMAVMYTEESRSLTGDEKDILLNLSREKLESIYGGERMSLNISGIPESLKQKRGCFTTLNMDDQLRGCIGHIYPQEELYRCVLENTENAALHDSRFVPVKKEELEDIEIEISVLSVPVKTSLEEIDEGDGVVLKQGMRQATYLPQVWEQLLTKTLFLSSLCEKAGLKNVCWKEEDNELFEYSAEVFSERP